MINPSKRQFLRAAFCGLCASLCVSTAQAGDEGYPDRPIKFVVPYTAGGSNDVVGRVLAQKLSAYWDVPIIVENRAGAGGNLGAALVARSAADGYTFLITPNNLLTMNPYVYQKTGVGYDPIKDFAPVSLVATGPILLAVNAELPVNSVKELIAYAKANPGKLSYASAGVGTPHHLSAELFKSLTGVDMVHVPYKGAVPAVSDLAAGRVQVMFGIPNSLMPFVKTGQLKALAVSSLKPSAMLPDLPTVDASGVPGFNSSLWIGLTAPAGTPAAVIAKVNQGVMRAMQDPEVKASLEAQGLSADASTPQEFAALIEHDAARWSKLVSERKLSAD
ncbi:Bug family tripartite tricarboxylate transporter substrate binding protein [Bordetella petrii]|uniref:Bug family tripartite tricarboxylate transporter substrate binding protein n=1 Tax=Bordetella petrii TaxID=94624 RepID=UPI001A96448D|nr:tripartite tricarboxylate transporter substrate binding protein [Bordetella petrii]MBO1110842.1 tripartite tricarboxylate transporter substrate binding protein [Bordetella petrii]